MLRGLYSSVSAMITLQEKQSVITNNISNVNTNGYKSETLVTKSFDDMILSNKDNYVNGQGKKQTIGSLSPGVKIDDTTTNFTQGTLVETNSSYDMAIDGRGFFTVRDENGKEYYSRDGAFTVNSNGYLVNSAGYYVIGNDRIGNSGKIYIGNEEIKVQDNGDIYLNSNLEYKITISDFNDYNQLKKIGNNSYSSSENPINLANYNIKQGYKEISNVDIIEESSQLISNLRAFEANQKVIQTMDSTLSKIASEIGRI